MANGGLVSVIVPVLDESENIDPFYDRMTGVAETLSPMTLELILVDDGSQDDSFEKMARLARSDPRVRVVKLSRNFGHQLAITAGLDHAHGDCVVRTRLAE